MSELVVVFVLCACSVIVVVSHVRALAGGGANSRELDRLLGAVDRACADFLWHETRLLALLLLLIGLALSVPFALWHAQQAEGGARLGLSALALLLGGAAGAGVARIAHWAASRATARALAELREDPDAASSAVFRGAVVAALVVDAASSLLPCGMFVAHYAYLTWVARLEAGTALFEASRSTPVVALGATCAAVIFQVGGSSFQTAASIAGSSARARDRRIALDDEQNPALIAELVGNYVGGVVFRSTDTFAALVLANSAVIVLSGAMARANPTLAASALGLVGVPLLVRASGLLAAAVSLGSLRLEAGLSPARAFAGAGASQALIAATGLLGAAFWLLGDPLYVAAFGAGALGIASSLACQGLLLAPDSLRSRSFLGGVAVEPATSMARALGLGLQRAWAPLLVAGTCLGTAYALGSRTPLRYGGAYALLLAVAGMLGSGALHLCSSAFSGIVSSVRRIGALRRGRYDLAARGRAAELERSSHAIGNWGDTQAILAGTAAALLGAVTLPLLDTTSLAGTSPAEVVGLGHPIVVLGGILGIATLSFYVGGVLENSSRVTSALVEELSQQGEPVLPATESEARPLPSYRTSVQRAASAATEALLPLAAAALLAPIVIGLLLRLVYGPTGATIAAHGLMALASISVLTGGSAALAAQGALMALGLIPRPHEGNASGRSSSADSAREFVGHSVGPAALLGLKATVVSALAIAPLLFSPLSN
ncbi:MAG: sodium/proton-translocating pyrophosphatase [Deltaproteobacteria bacterium]